MLDLPQVVPMKLETNKPPDPALKVLLQEVVLHALPDVPPVDDHVVVPELQDQKKLSHMKKDTSSKHLSALLCSCQNPVACINSCITIPAPESYISDCQSFLYLTKNDAGGPNRAPAISHPPPLTEEGLRRTKRGEVLLLLPLGQPSTRFFD